MAVKDVLRYFGFYGHDISEFISCGEELPEADARYSGYSVIITPTLTQVTNLVRCVRNFL